MADDTNSYGDLPYVMSGLQRRRNPYDQRRQMALGMMQGGMDMSPVAHPLQGASRLAQALVGSLMMGKIDSDEKAADQQRQDAIGKASALTDPNERLAAFAKIDPEIGMRYGAQMAVQEATAKRNADMFQQGANRMFASYGGGGPTGPQQAAMPPEQAKATAQEYVNYLVQKHGFKPEEAASMVGNLYQESGFNPTAVHDNGTGFGLGGWRLDRRDALMNFAQQTGRDPRDPQTQLDFYATELKSRPEFAKFQAAQTPEQRQLALMDYYRPAGWTPQTPQNGNGFGARLQYGQTFAGGAAPQGQGQLPVPQPPGAAPQQGAAPQGAPAPQGAQPPAWRDTPRPQPSPEVLTRARDMMYSGAFGDPRSNPTAAMNGARQWIEQQIDHQWQRDQARDKAAYDLQVNDFKDARTQAGKAPQEAFNNAAKLRDDFKGMKAYQDFEKASVVFRSAVSAAKNDTKAADIDLVYAFATMMDPGSVVRDSETGMVRATQSASSYVQGLVQGLQGKATFDPQTRQNLLAQMANRYESYKVGYEDAANALANIGQRAGIPRENIVIPLSPVEYEKPSVKQFDQKPGAAPKLAPSGPTTVKTPTGNVIIERAP